MNLQKTKKSGKIETKWCYSKNLETYLHVLLSNCLVPGCCTFSPLTIKRILPPSPFLLSRIYVSLPKRTPQICWRKIPSFLPFLISFLSYFLPFYNRFSHGNNILCCPSKNKISSFFQNSVDSPSKQMTARFLMPKKPRNMIQKTSNKIK